MSKYSDYLPRFGRNRHRNDDRGQARFDHFIEAAQYRRQKPRSRPGLKVVAMIVLILGLGWGLSERTTVMTLLGAKTRSHRTVVPLAIAMGSGEPPEYSSELIQAHIAQVTPRAQACLLAFPDLQRDASGKVEVEVVLGSGGALEAAVYGQASLPDPVARCVGTALGSVKWPQPPWNRKLRFSVIGGAI